MPGDASTTPGIALTAGIAVMMWPSSMNSSIVVAWKSGGGRKLTVVWMVGRSSIWIV